MSHRRCVTPSGRVKSQPLTLTLYQLPRSFFGRVHTWHTRVLCALCLTCLEKDLRQFMKLTRKHAPTLVAMYIKAFSVAARSPVAMSCCETSNSSSQERDVTFSSPSTQDCANKNESRGTRKDGAIETQHVCIAVKTPR